MGKKSGSPQGDTKSAEVRPEDAQTELKSPAEAPKMSVDYWRDAVFPPSRRHPQHPELRLHNEAAARHGWALHQHHFGEPMRLTADDYRAALDAGQRNKADEAQGRPRVHLPALFQLKPGSGDR